MFASYLIIAAVLTLIAGHLTPSFSWITYGENAVARVQELSQKDVTLGSAREVMRKYKRA